MARSGNKKKNSTESPDTGQPRRSSRRKADKELATAGSKKGKRNLQGKALEVPEANDAQKAKDPELPKAREQIDATNKVEDPSENESEQVEQSEQQETHPECIKLVYDETARENHIKEINKREYLNDRREREEHEYWGDEFLGPSVLGDKLYVHEVRMAFNTLPLEIGKLCMNHFCRVKEDPKLKELKSLDDADRINYWTIVIFNLIHAKLFGPERRVFGLDPPQEEVLSRLEGEMIEKGVSPVEIQSWLAMTIKICKPLRPEGWPECHAESFVTDVCNRIRQNMELDGEGEWGKVAEAMKGIWVRSATIALRMRGDHRRWIWGQREDINLFGYGEVRHYPNMNPKKRKENKENQEDYIIPFEIGPVWFELDGARDFIEEGRVLLGRKLLSKTLTAYPLGVKEQSE